MFGSSRSSEMARAIFTVFFLLAVLAAIAFVAIGQSQSQHKRISDWAMENGYHVESIERTVFDIGPFWMADEDTEIYRATLVDTNGQRRVCYFRFYLWSMDYAWQ